MKTHSHASRLLAGSAAVIWLGGLASLLLAVAVGLRTGLVFGALAGATAVILTASALALVQMARAMLEIARNTAVLAGRAAEEDVDDIAEEEAPDQPDDLPPVVGRIEPSLRPQGRVEPPVTRATGDLGGLRAVRLQR